MGRFILKALTGPVEGKVFPVKHNLRIGRSSGDIILKDRLVSDLHAEIQIYSSGKIMLFDKDSKNKIVMNNKKIVKSILETGTKFKIGETEFELAFVRTPEEIWSEFIQESAKNIKDQPLSLKTFSRAVEIVFVSGLQKGQKYYAAYGPRFFGSHSVDFPIFEKKSPNKAFALVPNKQNILFITEHKDIVRLNDKKIREASIKNGDRILIENSILKINLK